MEAPRPRGSGGRRALESGQYSPRSFTELSRRSPARKPGGPGPLERLEYQEDGVTDARQGLGAERTAMRELAARLGEGDQVSGE
ncbi:MAG TPA: hypothetical protein VLT32_20945, partial [Candidatus Sulfomarinibacteraceae bacterium]|nr:hypothetical protein [Candidatus Sulfomarinibacteraceae bacterium]